MGTLKLFIGNNHLHVFNWLQSLGTNRTKYLRSRLHWHQRFYFINTITTILIHISNKETSIKDVRSKGVCVPMWQTSDGGCGGGWGQSSIGHAQKKVWFWSPHWSPTPPPPHPPSMGVRITVYCVQNVSFS